VDPWGLENTDADWHRLRHQLELAEASGDPMRIAFAKSDVKEFERKQAEYDPQPLGESTCTGGGQVGGGSGHGTDLDQIQTTLDAAGMVPGLGEPADFTNGIISTARGNYGDAGFSFAAMVPFVGNLATPLKYADEAVDAVKALDKTNDAGKAVDSCPTTLSPTNYPKPDPPMDVPPVRYDPQTNEELMRMRNGQGPTTKATHGDQNIEAHHRGQVPTSQGGVIDEITYQQHRGPGNHSRHSQPSQLTPSERAKEVRDHYKERSKEYVTDGEGI
jgi:hypothetical protein